MSDHNTTLICVKVAELRKIGFDSLEEWLKNPNHIYIGRTCAYIKGTYNSKWRNPYSVQKYGRDECLKKYKDYIVTNDELMEDIKELEGKVLGCWCCPDKCHGDILIDLLEREQKVK